MANKKTTEVNEIKILTDPIKIEEFTSECIDKTNEVEELKKTVNELQDQLSRNSKLIEQFMNSQLQKESKSEDKVEIKPSNRSRNIDMNRQVTILHLEDRAPGLFTIFKSSTRDYYMSYFGQEINVLFTEFQDIFSVNQGLFFQNILCLSDDDADILEMPSYKILKNNNVLEAHHLKNIASLSNDELTNIYNAVCFTHKQLIVRKWTQGYHEYMNKLPESNSAYANYQKLHALNELTVTTDMPQGALKNLINDLEDKRRRGIAI